MIPEHSAFLRATAVEAARRACQMLQRALAVQEPPLVEKQWQCRSADSLVARGELLD
jgi:hypothetical protein